MLGISRRTALVSAVAVVVLVSGLTAAQAATDEVIVDTAVHAGVYQVSESWTNDVVDVNGDGFDDIFLGGHDRGGVLLLNDQDGTFSRPAASVSAWPKQTSKYVDRHSCSWADVNADGLTDTYCAVGRTLANWVKGADYDNELWLQQPDGSFIDRGTRKGVGDPYGRGKDSIIFDVNGDGRLDIYSMNSQPRDEDPNPELTVNKLFVQRPRGTFREAPGYGLNKSLGHGLCGWATDWDGDGDQDLFVCGTDLLYYLQNNDGQFVSRGQQIGIGRDYGYCEPADIDDDGDLDIVGVRYGEVAYHSNDGDGTFSPSTIIDTVQHNVGSAVADANADGYLDIAVVRGTEPPAATVNPRDFLYLNPGEGADWTRVPLPTTGGAGTDVQAITVLPGQRPRFLVGNGNFNLLGPVQLLKLVPQAP